jgi:3-oxoacyl-[acyl-carrier protein] reductase
MIDLSSRVALVTGAGSGIGRASALLLARAGARVALVEILADRLERVVDEFAQLGYEVEGILADVTRSEQVDAAVQRALQRWGGLDIVFANAGINGHGLVVDMDEAEWDRVIEADLDSVFYTTRAAIPALKRSRHGRVICTASHYGVIGKEGMANYSAAKGGVIGLMRSLALELGPFGITANAVAPGPVQTAIIERTAEQIEAWKARLPLGRLGEPQDVAGAVVFLASDLSAWITGHVLQVNGGAFLQ